MAYLTQTNVAYTLLCILVSLLPRPSHPSVCHLQHWRGGRPDKSLHMQWRTWTLGGRVKEYVAHSQKTHKCATECSHSPLSSWVVDIWQSWWVQKAAPQLYRRNVPLLHTSTQRPGTSLHVSSVSAVSDKRWGEEAWVRGTRLHSVNRLWDHTQSSRNSHYGVTLEMLNWGLFTAINPWQTVLWSCILMQS